MMGASQRLSAGTRFALHRQLAIRGHVLAAYVLIWYCAPWLWNAVAYGLLDHATEAYRVAEYNVLGSTLALGALSAAVLAVSGFRSLISMGVGRIAYLWTQAVANLCFSLCCAAVATIAAVLTPQRDADFLVTFRAGEDLRMLTSMPVSVSFGRPRFLYRDLHGSFSSYMNAGAHDYVSNPLLLFLSLFLLIASSVTLGQCVGELLARTGRYGVAALMIAGCLAWAARPKALNDAATDLNPKLWKLLEALQGRWCLMWKDGQMPGGGIFGTSNERLVYDFAYTFWPMAVFFACVTVLGNLACWLLVRRRETHAPQLVPVWW